MRNESYTLETLLANFEASWASRSRDEIVQAISEHRDSPELLEELVHADLELRLKQGENARIEFYLDRFPELDSERHAGALLKTEYTIRRRREPGLDFSEYVVRFPALYPCLLEITPVSDWESQWKKSRAESGKASQGSSGEENGLEQTDDLGAAGEVSYMSLRFSTESIHASGGLGNIWLAHDHELNRKVALKEIRNKHAGNPALQARFIQEAMITGALDHPGVAPVYSLSRFRDGRPYYAMRLVRGATLADRIRAFHQNNSWTGDLRQNLEFRRLIRHFLDACNTIEYAHSRGVIHRDIKPANILIGEYGETLVVDWGLAKLETANAMMPRGGGETQRESEQPPPPSSRQATGSGSKESPNGDAVRLPVSPDEVEFWSSHQTTSVGDIVGSPAFMSPEQAQGNPSAVGFRSDVYSLGATLFTLLTNTHRRLPEKGGNETASPSGPGLLAASMRPLLSICAKSMSTDPCERYDSPGQLKENVERFLANLPVDCHRESYPERFARLTRRHSTLVRTVIVALFLAALVATGAAIWINGERKKADQAAVKARLHASAEEEARLETERAAESSRNLASIVNDILLYGDGPSNRGRLPSRQQYIEKFEAEILNADPITRMRGLMVIGQNESRLGDQAAARDYYVRAMEICRETMSEDSADYLECLSGLLAMTHWAGEGSRAAQLADELVSRVEASPAADAGHKISAYSIDAEIKRDSLQYEKALAAARLAEKIAESEFGGSDRMTVEARNLVAGILVSRGQPQDLDEAAKMLDELERVVAANGLSETRTGLAVINSRGHLLMQRSRFGMASGLFRNLVNVRTRVFGARDPETLKASRSLGDCRTRAALEMEDRAQRLAGLEEAIEILEQTRDAQLAVSGVGSAEYGTTLLFLGNAWRHHSKLKPLDETTYQYRSRTLVTAIYAAQHRSQTDVIALRLRNILGTLHLSVREIQKAIEQYSAAEEGWKQRQSENPDESLPPAYDQLIVNYANLLQVNGKPDVARPMLERLIRSHPRPQLNWHVYLANCCYLSGDMSATAEAFEPVFEDFKVRAAKRVSATEFHVLLRVLTAMELLNLHDVALEQCRHIRRDRAWTLSQQQHCELNGWRHLLLVRNRDYAAADMAYEMLENSECDPVVRCRVEMQQLESLVARNKRNEAFQIAVSLRESDELLHEHECFIELLEYGVGESLDPRLLPVDSLNQVVEGFREVTFFQLNRKPIVAAVSAIRSRLADADSDEAQRFLSLGNELEAMVESLENSHRCQ